MKYSTKNSIIGIIADNLGINKKFHRYKKDAIDDNPDVVVSPVEAQLVDCGPIGQNGIITSKQHKQIKLSEIIGGHAKSFVKGMYFNFYLNAKAKHYWRIPYDSELISATIHDGRAVFPAFVGLDNLFAGNIFFTKAIKKNASIGLVFTTNFFPYAMIPVGSLNVNGIHVVNDNDGKYAKGDIGGYFSIGSSMLLCFPDYPYKALITIGNKVNIGEAIIKLTN